MKFLRPLHKLSAMKCFTLAAALLLVIAATEGRRYGEKRISINKEILYGPKHGSGIINKKKSGFYDDIHKKGFLGGSKTGLKKSKINYRGGPLIPGNAGVLGDDLGPRGPFVPRATILGDLGWQGIFGSDIPLIPGGINTQINGGMFPDSQFGGRFGPEGFNGDLGGFDQIGIQNGRRFRP